MVKSGVRLPHHPNLIDANLRQQRFSSGDESDPNDEARQMAISMVPKITNRCIRVANKNPSASGRFYELPPPSVEIE